MERRSFLGAVAAAPLAPLTLKESPQGPPGARSPEVVKLFELHHSIGATTPDKHGMANTDLVCRTMDELARHKSRYLDRRRNFPMLSEDTNTFAVNEIEAKFDGTKFLAVSFDWPEGFYPRHALEVPAMQPNDWSDTVCTENYFNGFVSRDAALAEAAEANSKASDEAPFVDWYVCVEIGSQLRSANLATIEVIGDYGFFDGCYSPYVLRIVRPTAAEIARHCPGQEWTWLKGGAA